MSISRGAIVGHAHSLHCDLLKRCSQHALHPLSVHSGLSLTSSHLLTQSTAV